MGSDILTTPVTFIVILCIMVNTFCLNFESSKVALSFFFVQLFIIH